MNLRAVTPELRNPLRQSEPDADQEAERRSLGQISSEYHALKDRLHAQLLGRIDLEVMGTMKPERLREELGLLVERLIQESGAALNTLERRRLTLDIQDEIMGLGPLEPLLADPTVSDILINGPRQVFVERRGRLELSEVVFSDTAHLMKIIDKIVSRIGRRVDESSPMVDARLPDGSRVNAIIPPLALDGPLVSIRRFATVPLTIRDLIDKRSLTPMLAELLSAMVKAKLNILISGGTGTGKTTLTNAVIAEIIAASPEQRLVILEDTAEIQCAAENAVCLHTTDSVDMNRLLKSTMRLRPDRIVVGEVRDGAALTLLKAWNTGHPGGVTTIHANNALSALTRLEQLTAEVSQRPMAEVIGEAVDLVIWIERIPKGRRVRDVLLVEGYRDGRYRVESCIEEEHRDVA